MLKNKLPFLLCVMLLPSLWEGMTCFAQDFKADMQKMQDAYKNIKKMSAVITISIYPNAASAQALANKTAVLKKQDDNYFYSLDEMILVMNEKYSVMVYKADRQIICSDRNLGEEKKAAYAFASPAIDSLLSKYKSVEYKGIQEGCKQYVVQTIGAINRTELSIDASTYLINSVTYYYDPEKVPDAGKVTVQYKINEGGSDISASDFSEKQFFTRSGDHYVPSKSYKGYIVSKINPDEL
jgi:outer membrane lipoprotein-sorting protein